jgi:hypothetical protein
MILVAASCFSQLNHLSLIRTIVYKISDAAIFEEAALPGFIQQSADAPKLVDFRRHIAPLIVQTKDDTADIVFIQHWVRGQENDQQFYSARGPMLDDTEDPQEYLDQQHKGRRSACRRFSFILCGALLSAGINARFVSLAEGLDRSTSLNHDLVEVWVAKRHKWMLVDPTADAFVLVNGRPASLLEVYTAAQPGSNAQISFDQHGSHYRLPPLSQYRRYFRHLYVAKTNAFFDGYRYGLLGSKRIEFVHYAAPGIEPYPQRMKELLLVALAVSACLAALLIMRCIAELLSRVARGSAVEKRRLFDLRQRGTFAALRSSG